MGIKPYQVTPTSTMQASNNYTHHCINSNKTNEVMIRLPTIQRLIKNMFASFLEQSINFGWFFCYMYM